MSDESRPVGVKIEESHCNVCGKALTEYTSIKFGIGPVCRAKMGIKNNPSGSQREMFMGSFEAQFDSFVRDGVLAVIDTGWKESRSVTNDVENVVIKLNEEYGDLTQFKRIIYRDSEKEWDRIVVDEKSQFQAFAPCKDRGNGDFGEN